MYRHLPWTVSRQEAGDAPTAAQCPPGMGQEGFWGSGVIPPSWAPTDGHRAELASPMGHSLLHGEAASIRRGKIPVGIQSAINLLKGFFFHVTYAWHFQIYNGSVHAAPSMDYTPP